MLRKQLITRLNHKKYNNYTLNEEQFFKYEYFVDLKVEINLANIALIQQYFTLDTL